MPRSFETVNKDGVLIPLSEVIQAGIDNWSDYLVGFFFDYNLPYLVVKDHCFKA